MITLQGYKTPSSSYEERKIKYGRGCAPELLDKMDGANVLSIVEENVTDQDNMSGSQENDEQSVNESDEDGKCSDN